MGDIFFNVSSSLLLHFLHWISVRFYKMGDIFFIRKCSISLRIVKDELKQVNISFLCPSYLYIYKPSFNGFWRNGFDAVSSSMLILKFHFNEGGGGVTGNNTFAPGKR